MVDRLIKLPNGTKFTILAPYVRGKKGEYRKQMQQMVKEGFTRAIVNGDMVELADPPTLDKQKKHTIDIVIDRLVVKEGMQQRLADSLETATRVAKGLVKILYAEGNREEEKSLAKTQAASRARLLEALFRPRQPGRPGRGPGFPRRQFRLFRSERQPLT